jgi:hypothetical protein
MNWTNVKKQKPPLDTKILVLERFKYGTLIYIAEYIKYRHYKRPIFGSNIEREKDGTVYNGFPLENVTHWMLLPESPKFTKPYKDKKED